MYAMWWITAAVVGALCAARLRVPIFRLSVGAGEPDRTACGGCGRWPLAAVPAPHGRCRFCGSQVGPRWAAVELVSAAAAAAVFAARGPGIEAVGLLGIVLIGVALAAVDISTCRLPNRLILWAVAVAITWLGVSLAGGDWRNPVGSVLGAAGMTAAYLSLAILSPSQFGLGDVKLAIVLGATLGWFGWRFVVIGACVPFLLSAVCVLVLLAMRRISLRSSIPFGPFMVAGTVLTVLI